MAAMTPSRLPRIRREIPPDEEPFLDLPEPALELPQPVQAPSSPQRARSATAPRSRLGRTPEPPSALRSPPSSGAIAATSLRTGLDDEDEPAPGSSYSLRSRDLPLSVARRSS